MYLFFLAPISSRRNAGPWQAARGGVQQGRAVHSHPAQGVGLGCWGSATRGSQAGLAPLNIKRTYP